VQQPIDRAEIQGPTAAALSTTAHFAVNALADDDLSVRAKQTIADFQNADSSLKGFMDSSAGYAVFPSVGKGGLIVGGARGTGVLFEYGAITGRTTMTQGSVGARLEGKRFPKYD
jgi:hypothetical protein